MDVKIEKGVPMPHGRIGWATKYPWYEMNIGDSFVASGGARSGLSHMAKATGFKFTSRKIGENEFRIWRVK